MSGPVEKPWQRGKRYLAQGQLAPARAMLESLMRLDAEDARTHLLRSNVLFAEDRLREAAEVALAAAHRPMDSLALRLDAVDALLKTGETVAARNCLAHAPIASGSRDDLTRAAVQWQSLGEHAEALRLLEGMRQPGIDDQEASFYRGVQHGFMGDLERAEAELQRCAQTVPPQGRAFVELARLRRQTPERNHLELLQQQLTRVEPGSENHAALQFALYKELEDLGRYDEAWEALTAGNALMNARLRYDPEAERNLVDGLIEACAGRFEKQADAKAEGPSPIFVVGLPRSGTTLLERILGNHSQVMSAGELPDFGLQLARCVDRRRMSGKAFLASLQNLDFAELGRRYLAQTQWRAKGRPYYLDKQPSNWIHAGLVHLALPHARIVHLVREPMDVCFSNYRAFFGNAYAYSYDFSSLAHHHAEYRRLTKHWQTSIPERMLEVEYSRLVHEPETVAREVFAFCGIPWEPDCTDLSRNDSPIATLSLAQARNAIRTDTAEAWRPYADRMGVLRNALERRT
ncbi:MAG TPA: sulfotransferase [Rhodanobacteraceae bacterium]